jgi:hypothetical protein
LVSINGGQKPAVRIQANPMAMANYGLSLEDLRSALATANVDQAKGSLNGTHQAYTIGANDQLLSSTDYNKVIIAYRRSPVRLSDVANAVDSAENLYQAAWMGTAARTESKDAKGNLIPAHELELKPAVIVNIQRQPGANIIGVVDEVQKLLPQLRSTLPATVTLEVLTDRTNTIPASVKDLQFSLMLTIALVMVIFLPAVVRRQCHPLDRRRRSSAPSGDVPAGPQPPTTSADGADHLDRLRGRRCHRDDPGNSRYLEEGDAPLEAKRRLGRSVSPSSSNGLPDRGVDSCCSWAISCKGSSTSLRDARLRF